MLAEKEVQCIPSQTIHPGPIKSNPTTLLPEQRQKSILVKLTFKFQLDKLRHA